MTAVFSARRSDRSSETYARRFASRDSLVAAVVCAAASPAPASHAMTSGTPMFNCFILAMSRTLRGPITLKFGYRRRPPPPRGAADRVAPPLERVVPLLVLGR